ncbi:MAG: hypothetical protein ACRDFY_01680 [Candidatus Limnocylindria bacterium]
MSVYRPSDPAAEPAAPESSTPGSAPLADRGSERAEATSTNGPAVGPLSLEAAEARYITARDAWTDAMRRCRSGRAADLASLALAQEAYELATAEVQQWRSGGRAAIAIEPEARRTRLEAAIGQEMAWRRVHQVTPKKANLIARTLRRLTGRA